MTLYDDPKPTAELPRKWSSKASIYDPVAETLLANPGKWFAIGEGKSHNGIGTLKNRLGAHVPGVEMVGRKDYERGVVVLYARVPEVSG